MRTTPEDFPTVEGGRIGLVGDTHANTAWFMRVIQEMAADNIDVIVQLGDFGWWPESRFAWKVSRTAAQAGVDVLFVDGNHEHHPHLRKTACRADPDYEHLARPVQLHPRLWYLPRGCAWEWNNVRFRALGGASSIDRHYRVEGKSWFTEEVPSDEDLQRAIDAGPTDVLLTHDYPALGYALTSTMNPPEDLERISREVRDRLAGVARAINPQLVVHGHWHHRYSTRRDGISIEGLNCDGCADSAVVLNLDTLQTEDWSTLAVRRR